MSTQIRVRIQSGPAAGVPAPSPVTSVAGRTGAVVLGVADVSGALANTAAAVGSLIAGATAKATPGDADSLALEDAGALKKFSWGNLKSALNSVFARLAGVSGGQTLIGGTGTGENLTLRSTSHATRGAVVFGSASEYDEANDRLGLGTLAPAAKMHAIATTQQQRLGYDASNYYGITVSASGIVTHDATSGQYRYKSINSTATLGSELVSNGDFASSLSGWTDSGSSWSWSSGAALHTAGSASTLSQTLSITSGSTYQVAFTISGRTAGTVSVSLGSVAVVQYGTLTTFTASTTRSAVAAESGSVTLTITPSTDFDGRIDDVSVKLATLASVTGCVVLTDSASATSLTLRTGLAAMDSHFAGDQSGRSILSSASRSSAFGSNALRSLTAGTNNSCFGAYAGYSLTNGQTMVAVGSNSGYNATTAYASVFVGHGSGYNSTTCGNNVFVGSSSGYANVTAGSMTLVGATAGTNLTTGTQTTALGNDAARYLANGSTALTSSTNGLYLGYNAKASADGVTNEVVIGAGSIGMGSNTIVLGNTSNVDSYLYGDINLDKTVTSTGTTGAQTINKTCGSVNFAAGATSLVVTNNRVTASSIIVATVATADATMKSVVAVAAAGSFTLTANAAATAETRVNWIVIN